MKTKIFIIFLSIIFATLASIGIVTYAQKNDCPDSEVYDGRIILIKGKAFYLNHPTLGKTPATTQMLVFQREDCKKCIFATYPDIDGNYKILVGEGRYKIIAKEIPCDYGGLGCDCYDLLGPKQPKFVDAKRSLDSTEFNIDLVLPKR
ncbi:MAG TPA: hypothetical protein PKY82_27280 [Pyrinomonadaceae bacterium]|nr:hypothetical protein [Pyrinomonadaceae bacterium]